MSQICLHTLGERRVEVSDFTSSDSFLLFFRFVLQLRLVSTHLKGLFINNFLLVKNLLGARQHGRSCLHCFWNSLCDAGGMVAVNVDVLHVTVGLSIGSVLCRT